MNILKHKLLIIDKPTFNFVQSDSLNFINESLRPKLFGIKQGLGLCFIGISGMGKTNAMLCLPENFQFAVMGETIIKEGVKYIGAPPNLPNLNTLLKASSGLLLIDSLSALHPGDTRLGTKGLNKTQFELMQEIDTLAAMTGHIIGFSYNPFDTDLYPAALKEIEGRLRAYVVLLANYKCQVMNPITRKFSKVISNEKVWDYMTDGYRTDSTGSSTSDNAFLRI